MRRSMLGWLSAVGLIAGMTLGTVAARAETTCGLKMVASLDVLRGGNEIRVPLVVDGRTAPFLVDTGAFWSVVARPLVEDLTVLHSPVDMVGSSGEISAHYVKAPDFAIGQYKLHKIDFIVSEGDDPKADFSVLGVNIMQAFDVEIDPVLGKVLFLSQDHCPGRVAHWPNRDLVSLPLTIGAEGQMTIPVLLDGKPLRALIDTGATDSVLPLAVARDVFGIDTDSDGTRKADRSTTMFGDKIDAYRRRFHTLTLQGITFTNPVLLLLDDRARGTRYQQRLARRAGLTTYDMVLGLNELLKLHLYFAYGEKMLYASTVEGELAARREAGETIAGAAIGPYSDAGAVVAKLLASAKAHAEARDYAKEVADLDLAIGADPAEPTLYARRALAHLAQKDAAHALADASQLVTLAPNQMYAYNLRAAVELAEKQRDAALADFGKAIALAPNRPEPLRNRCQAFAAMSRFEDALKDCDAAIALDPGDAALLQLRGSVHMLHGQDKAALADFDAALKIDPKAAAALYARALIERHGGRKVAAAADMTAAQRIDPTIAEQFSRQPDREP